MVEPTHAQNISQIGNLPQIGVTKLKKLRLKPPPSNGCIQEISYLSALSKNKSRWRLEIQVEAGNPGGGWKSRWKAMKQYWNLYDFRNFIFTREVINQNIAWFQFFCSGLFVSHKFLIVTTLRLWMGTMSNVKCEGVRILVAKVLSLSESLSRMDRFECHIMTRHALEPEGFSGVSSKWNLSWAEVNISNLLANLGLIAVLWKRGDKIQRMILNLLLDNQNKHD